ncbi:MAG: MBOAT family O-acyltransferase [Bacteroidota bacterium]
MLLPQNLFFLAGWAILLYFYRPGYLIDVYNGEIKAEKNLGIVALFLSFFPLVTSGPIERANPMFGKFGNPPGFVYSKAVKGLQAILWGYFMKLVIADRIAIYVSEVFSKPDFYSGKSLLFATLINPIEVYADLGGYSLIAIGSALIMGFEVRPNFNRPFFATSLSVFWRRWHMSFISWLTDYVFIPLTFYFRRYRKWGIVIALLMTFLISGLWHGAAITTILWGFSQGIILSFEVLANDRKKSIENLYNLKSRWWYIFLSCLNTYLIFAGSFLISGTAGPISSAIYIIQKIFTDHHDLFIENSNIILAFSGVLLLFMSEFRDEYYPGRFLLFDNRNVFVRRASYISVFILILLIGLFQGNGFIYFQY